MSEQMQRALDDQREQLDHSMRRLVETIDQNIQDMKELRYRISKLECAMVLAGAALQAPGKDQGDRVASALSYIQAGLGKEEKPSR